MDLKLRTDALRSLLTRYSAGDATFEAAHVDIRAKEATGEAGAAEARVAIEALRAGRPLGPTEMYHLEAIVLPNERPVALVKDDTWDTGFLRFPALNTPATKALFLPVLRAVGRIEVPGIPTLPYAGTGFLVGPGLLLTNRHVAELFARGLRTEVQLIPSTDPRIDFRREQGGATDGSTAFTITGIVWIHPHWDAALLRIAGPLAERQPLTLLPTAPSDLAGKAVAVVGYPARDPRNDLYVQDAVFQSIYQVKRLQPGLVTGPSPAESFGHEVVALGHDASTLGGNSGSAVVDVATGQVVGLHFGGVYLRGNWAVPAYELARDPKVVGEGVQFAGTVPQSADWLSAWTLTETLAATAAAPAATEAAARSMTGDWWEALDEAELRAIFARDPRGAWEAAQRAFGPGAEEWVARVRAPDGALGIKEAPVQPSDQAPVVVFLHGIMGGHLRETVGGDARIWLNPLRTVFTDLGPPLSLAADGLTDLGAHRLTPAGHLQLFYGAAARAWAREGIDVRPYSFDWRKPIEVSARLFAAWIDATLPAGTSFTLVCHSMGGLVALEWAAADPGRVARVRDAVLVGSPARGSYAPVEAVLGVYPFLKKMAALTASTNDSLRAMATTLTGLLDMLPDPDVFPDAGACYTAASWPLPFRPRQEALDRSRALKARLATSPLQPKTTLIVAAEFGTVDRLVGSGITPGPRTGRGDGTVPLAATFLPDVARTLVATGKQHDQLMNHDGVIRTVIDLAAGRLPGALPALDPAALPAPSGGTEALVEAPTTDGGDDIRARWATGDIRATDVLWLFDPESGPLAEPDDAAFTACACDEEDLAALETLAVTALAAPAPELSGPQWCPRYPGSTRIDALADPFRTALAGFCGALREAGATVSIAATYRPPERAWLMHHAWRIAREGLDPAVVPARPGIAIQWVHPTAEASKAAAEAMVAGYRMAHRAALSSRHTEGRAVDMKVRWTGVLQVKNPDGTLTAVDAAAGDDTKNAALHAVGARWGVKKLVSDPPHWSADGH